MSNRSPASPPTLPTPVVPRKPTWPFLVALAAVAGLAELAYAIVNVSALPVYLKFGLGLPKLVGFSLTAYYLAEAAFNSPMGSLADRLGRRRLMVCGASISVFTCIITALIRVPEAGVAGYWTVVGALLLLRVADGVGAAALWPAVFASVGDRIEPSRQAAAMSVLNITYMVGLAFGPLVGGLVNNYFSGDLPIDDPVRYAPSFYTASVCFFLAAVIAYFVAPRRAEQHLATAGAAGDSHPSTFSLHAIRGAFRRIPMLMLLVFVTFFGVGLIAPNVKLFAMERYAISELFFGQIMLYPALVIGALAVPLGRLSDMWGKARSIHWGMGICAFSLWLILLIPSEWALVALGSLLGVGFVLAFPAYMALLGELTGAGERGGMIGAVRMSQGVGALIGAALASPLYERIAHSAPFFLAGILLTIAYFLSIFFIHDRAKPPT